MNYDLQSALLFQQPLETVMNCDPQSARLGVVKKKNDLITRAEFMRLLSHEAGEWAETSIKLLGLNCGKQAVVFVDCPPACLLWVNELIKARLLETFNVSISSRYGGLLVTFPSQEK